MTLTPRSFDLTLDKGVALITLNRPDRLNALTFEVYGELATTFRSLDKKAEARAVVITGAGRGFCSGGDVEGIIAELFAKDARGLLEFTRVTGALIQAICELRRPVIAAVNGVAVGAGAVIASACDLRLFSSSARIGFIFPKVGLSGADMGASFLLPRIVGRGRAAELLFFGDLIDANEAERIGLVNRVVADEELDAFVDDWARRLAGGPPIAIAQTKRLLNNSLHVTMEEALEDEGAAQTINFGTKDTIEAVKAFVEKREPRFEGR